MITINLISQVVFADRCLENQSPMNTQQTMFTGMEGPRITMVGDTWKGKRHLKVREKRMQNYTLLCVRTHGNQGVGYFWSYLEYREFLGLHPSQTFKDFPEMFRT